MKLHSRLVGGLLLASAVSFIAIEANAADVYRAPDGVGYKDAVDGPVWAGFYAGVNGGYSWGEEEFSVTSPSALSHFRTSGGFGGGQIGYNWQPLSSGGYKDGPVLSRFVFGIEADLQGTGAGIYGTSATIPGLHPLGASARDDIDWFGTVRGRLGYAMGKSLVYVTGGVAFGGVSETLGVVGGSPVSRSSTDTGYVLGGGVEYLLNAHWSGKFEYQYIDLGSDTLSAVGGAKTATFDSTHAFNNIRFGVNYHFDRGYEPLK